jgi:hypothetical protein
MVLPLAVLQENIVGWPAAHLAKTWGAKDTPVAIPSSSHFVMCVFKNYYAFNSTLGNEYAGYRPICQ